MGGGDTLKENANEESRAARLNVVAGAVMCLLHVFLVPDVFLALNSGSRALWLQCCVVFGLCSPELAGIPKACGVGHLLNLLLTRYALVSLCRSVS